MNQMIELCEYSSLYEKRKKRRNFFGYFFSRSGYIRRAEAWVISKRSDSLYKKTKMVRLLVYIYSLNSLGGKKVSIYRDLKHLSVTKSRITVIKSRIHIA